jgi:UTP--glucose-1-phosphate uridylyltransferase
MNNKPVTKAVIAAAGFGTRFLPQTKAIPKEMLPLVDKPVIQYIVEELVSVGVKDIIIVTGYSKRAIEDHFDNTSEELLKNLRQGGESKEPLLKEVEKISELANFIYVRQKGPYGTGTPIMNAEHLLNNEPFFFTYSDDFFCAEPQRFQQMIDAYQKYNCPVLSTVTLTDDRDYDRYGLVDGNALDDSNYEITRIIEKPGKQNATSDQATVSGFLLTSDVFEYFHRCREQLDGTREFYAVDALNLMIEDGKRLVACSIQNGQFYDAGNKLSYLKTLFDFALKQPEIAEELKIYLESRLKEYNEQ